MLFLQYLWSWLFREGNIQWIKIPKSPSLWVLWSGKWSLRWACGLGRVGRGGRAGGAEGKGGWPQARGVPASNTAITINTCDGWLTRPDPSVALPLCFFFNSFFSFLALPQSVFQFISPFGYICVFLCISHSFCLFQTLPFPPSYSHHYPALPSSLSLIVERNSSPCDTLVVTMQRMM